jgi:hypothetical protein
VHEAVEEAEVRIDLDVLHRRVNRQHVLHQRRLQCERERLVRPQLERDVARVLQLLQPTAA